MARATDIAVVVLPSFGRADVNNTVFGALVELKMAAHRLLIASE